MVPALRVAKDQKTSKSMTAWFSVTWTGLKTMSRQYHAGLWSIQEGSIVAFPKIVDSAN